MILALALIIFVGLPLSIPLAFVWIVVPWVCDYYQKILEDRASSAATVKQFPPDVLQEIFFFCCGEEYVDFFYHFSLYRPGPDGRRVWGNWNAVDQQGHPEYNMAYILKGVCKDWKLLVERTPALWQKVLLDYNVGSEHTSFRSLEHCREMMQHVLLPRCAGLPLEINIRQLSKSHTGGDRSRPGQFEQLYNAHMEYIESMVGLLAEHGSRWSSLAFEACQDLADMNPNIHLEQFPSYLTFQQIQQPRQFNHPLKHLSTSTQPFEECPSFAQTGPAAGVAPKFAEVSR